MSAAHLCIRSELAHAFRLSSIRAGASCSVPDFLVPAVARRSHRPFSTSCRSKERLASVQATIEPPQQPIYSRPTIRSCIPFPVQADRGDIHQWLTVIDPYLPHHLRRQPVNGPDISSKTTPLDFAGVLNGAQDARHDILSHYALVEQRWDIVVWIAKKLVENGKHSVTPHPQLEPSTNVIWPETKLRTLDDLTNRPLVTQRARPPRKLKHTLNDLTSMPESINPQYRMIKRGIGQLWRSLGNMILVAVGDSDHTDDTVMSHVLQIIAHLHHIGFIPDSVYAQKASADDYALQQPDTLHLLSTKMLTALSDATWKAHEASVKVATQRLNARYFLGHEIPGSRYKIRVTEVIPSIWLELILWTCLHGGWIMDGSAILQQVSSNAKRCGWTLISWRELLEEGSDLNHLSAWRLFQQPEDAYKKAEDRVRTRKIISSEVVTAYVDGLVNAMRLGVGARGTAPEDLVDNIKKLKHFLDINLLSLGSTTWDTVISRLLESGGIEPERRPELLLSILDLAPTFGTEVNTVNASSKSVVADLEPPYFFEPTALALSLLHRTIRSYVHSGDIAGAMTTMKMLQQHTDSNKQRSLELFFETLKGAPLRHNELFTSRLPPIEFPAFENQLPIPLLAKLLDLATESKMYDLGRWLLFSDDLDGPLILPSMYQAWGMAASIIRFGTLAGENELVLRIVERTGTWDRTSQTRRMPYEFLTALLCTQIKLHRWQSIQGMQRYVLESLPSYRPDATIFAHFGAELLRTSSSPNGNHSTEKAEVCQAFTEFLFTWEGLVLTCARNELYCILAIMSTVDEEWKQYCSQFLAFSALQQIKLSTSDFNQVLGGILDGYGSSKGREVVDEWCYKPPKTFEPYRAPGGVPKMPKYRIGKGGEYESRPNNIELVQQSGVKLILRGRISPNRQTVWVILRRIQQEEDERRRRDEEFTIAKRTEVRGTLKWAARLLYYLGFDYEDIIRDLGSLAELAELESPPESRVAGPDEMEVLEL
jgi:hypothetical protein